MPDDAKKNDKKLAKEQRKPRQRHQQGKTEKKIDEPKSVPKVTVPQKPPVYESPPPEFYQNLKRETDEILKITEEENTKYKKKEIQSNWSKYEAPIETYETIDEQENLGADFQKLIEAPHSLGGHFQFKHEKSWDINTGPSQYDKYFEINMEDLNIALCTVPFYERNNIDTTIFNESDILTMNNRANRFKQKYFNDKSYSTSEMETQDKILNILREGVKCDSNTNDNENFLQKPIDTDKALEKEEKPVTESLNSKFLADISFSSVGNVIDENIHKVQNIKCSETDNKNHVKTDDCESPFGEKSNNKEEAEIEDKKSVRSKSNSPVIAIEEITQLESLTLDELPKETVPITESPEDLEKWLDDFLDG